MHYAKMIHQAYEETTQKTLALWNEHAEAGEVRTEPFYHPSKLAITSGNRAGSVMSGLLSDLAAAAQGDVLADIAPPNGMHFTFFAITQALYERPEEAEDITGLIEIFVQHCADYVMTIRGLRLVALPNQLLLAGLPDQESLYIRQSLVEHLLDTKWAGKIKNRYPNAAIPQIFWHSTLLRYGAQYLPESLRAYFRENQHKNFGSVSLPVKLVMTNYNWTDTIFLS